MLLFVGYYRGNLLDTFLEHDAKKHNKPSMGGRLLKGWALFAL
jgi:hypothetical protein